MQKEANLYPEAPMNQPSGGTQIDVKHYLRIILGRKLVFIICAILPVAAGAIYTFTKKPEFKATSRLEVNPGVRMPLDEKIYKDMGGSHSWHYISRQIDIMRGPTVTERTIKSLNDWRDRIPNEYMEPDISVVSTRGSFINIEATSPYRDYVLEYVKALTREFVHLKMEHREKNSSFALQNLTNEAERLNAKIAEIQGRIQDFRTEHNDILIEEHNNFSSNFLAKLSSKASDLKTERILIERQIATLEETDDPSLWISVINKIQQGVVMPAISKEPQQSQVDLAVDFRLGEEAPGMKKKRDAEANVYVEPLPFVFVLEKDENKRWERLKQQYEELLSKNARYSVIYKPAHPERIKCQDEMELVKAKMASEITTMLEKFKARHRSVKLEEEAMSEEVVRWQKIALSSSSKISKIGMLKDEEDRMKKLYQTLIERLEEVKLTSERELETILVVEEPRVSRVPPNVARNLFISIIFGLGFGCGMVFLLEYVDDSIKTTDDLREYANISGLGVVHSIEWNQKDLPSHRLTKLQEGNTIEAYRSIRTNILLSQPESSLRSILFTSALPSEGKTTTSVNVSMILAQGGFKVLLVDGDLRRPTIHKMFNLKNKTGFSSVLLENTPWNEAIQKTELENLDLLPAGPIVPDPSKLFHFSQVKDFLDQVGKHYDRVIIDSAPVLTVTDTVILSDWADGIVFVVHGAKTSRMAIIKSREALLDNASKIIGGIVNNLSLKRSSPYYYYYGYRYKYRYKYGEGKSPSSRDKGVKKERETQEIIV